MTATPRTLWAFVVASIATFIVALDNLVVRRRCPSSARKILHIE